MWSGVFADCRRIGGCKAWFVVDSVDRDRHRRDVRTRVIILGCIVKTVDAEEVGVRCIGRTAVRRDGDRTTLSRGECSSNRCVCIQSALIGDSERSAVVSAHQNIEIQRSVFVNRVSLIGTLGIDVVDGDV